jgi:4-amino-4-deoxy-L-arabinose transferase-like glycosyltransferase
MKHPQADDAGGGGLQSSPRSYWLATPHHCGETRWATSAAEWGLIAGILAVAFVARLARIHECGLSHFDAGVYAQSGLYPWTGVFHFQQGYFSPPLFPILIGLTNLALGGPTDWSGVLISGVASGLTVLVAWRMAREIWSPFAGVLAAILTAASGFQIAFARVGLTDSLFTLLVLAGLTACRSAIVYGGWYRVLVAGVLVGLACNTKYNGLLPILLSFGFLFGPRGLQSAARLSLVSISSAILYMPWAYWFHVEHGYARLIEHQRGYWLGFTHVLTNLDVMANQVDVVATPSLVLALVLVSIFLVLRLLWVPAIMLLATLVLVTILDMYKWPFIFWGAFALMGCWRTPIFRDKWGLAWGFAVLVVLPAAYTPYLRLWLPTDAMLCVLSAGGLACFVESATRLYKPSPISLANSVAACFAVFVAISALVLSCYSERAQFWLREVWPPRGGYREPAARITEKLGERDAARVFTMCRWPLNYYLLQSGMDVRPLPGDPWNLGELERNDFLVTDRAVGDTPSFSSTYESAKRRLRSEPIDAVDPDMPTLIDDYPWRGGGENAPGPASAQGFRNNPMGGGDYTIWLFSRR